MTMSEAVRWLHIPQPNYIKIDVDGIEHFILRGGADLLKNVESVLVEIDDDFISQSEETKAILLKAGFSLFKKCDLGVKNSFNQWWLRYTSR